MNHNPGKKHESFGLNVRSIVLTTIGLVGMLAAVLLVAWFGMHWLDRRMPRTPSPMSGRPLPRTTATRDVQPHQAYQMRQLRRQYRQRLSRYEWVEREQDAARIPIERAIELLAENELQVDWRTAPSSEKNAQEKKEGVTEGDEKASQATAAEVNR